MNQKGFAVPILLGILMLALVVLGVVVYKNRTGFQSEATEESEVVKTSTENVARDTSPVTTDLPTDPALKNYDDSTLDKVDAQMDSLDKEFDSTTIDSLTFE